MNQKDSLKTTQNTTELLGGIVTIINSTSVDSLQYYRDSLFTIEYSYGVTIPLPSGKHAYRFLIDSTRYDTDIKAQDKVIKSNGILKTVSIINIENPFRLDLGYEFADKSLGSDFSYERFSFNYSMVRTLSSSDGITFRLMGGFSKKQLPVQKLFYIGGEGSVRGFDYMDTKKFSGNQMLLAKLEYHFFNLYTPILETPIFLFYDIGLIGNKFNFNDPITSYGLGITDDDFRDSPSEYTIILYRTAQSNNGNWGIEFMYNYFFAPLGKDESVLP